MSEQLPQKGERHARRFDWDLARELHAGGMTQKAIAAKLSVSQAAVWRVVSPGALERAAEYARSQKGKGVCEECGGPMHAASHYHGSRHCKRCASELRRTNVRDHELKCVICQKWKPDSDFPRNRTEHARRGRHSSCRPCLTAAKRAWRGRNREKENTYQREYKRRRRAAAR